MTPFGRRRDPAGPLDYPRRRWLQVVFALTMLVLYAPIIVLIAYSFNQSRRNIVWTGFTTDWYAVAWNNDRLFEAFTNSLMIAFLATVIATVIGTMLAVGLWRFRFPGKPVFQGLVALPIIIPEICFGVALLVFFSRIGWPTALPWPLNLGNIVAAHAAFCFPFVTLVVGARLVGFDRSLEEAAKDLGASEGQVFRDIILPYLMPGIVAGALLSFTLSLDDFVITYFTAGPASTTFPVLIYSMVGRGSPTPEVNAASTVLILITVVVTLLAMLLQPPTEGDGDRG